MNDQKPAKKTLRVDHNETPFILIFESVGDKKPKNSASFQKHADSGKQVFIPYSDVNQTRNWNIGVSLYPGWTTLISKKLIMSEGMYYISPGNKEKGFYAIVKKKGLKKLCITETGSYDDIMNSDALNLSQFTVLSVDDLDDKFSKNQEIKSAKEASKEYKSGFIKVGLIAGIFGLGVLYNEGHFDSLLNKSGLNNGYEHQLAYDEYVKARKSYLAAWPTDTVAISEFINILDLGVNPSTYNSFSDWGQNINFSIVLDPETATSQSAISSGVQGDYIISISNPGYIDVESSLEETPFDMSGGSFSRDVDIAKIKKKTAELTQSTLLAPISKNWDVMYSAAQKLKLKMLYAQDGSEDYTFTASELIKNDKSGIRRAFLIGEPERVLTAVGYVQGKAPVSIESFKIYKSGYSDEMKMLIKVRGS